jgi:hypothetical protein
LLLLLRDGRLEFGDCALLFCDVPVRNVAFTASYRTE